MSAITVDELLAILGGTSAAAEFFDIKPPSVSEWRARGMIPEDKLMRLAPYVEQKTEGRVPCESSAPGISWVRVKDKSWPWHPQGKPLVDVLPVEG